MLQHSEIVVDQGYGGLNPVLFGYERCDPSHDDLTIRTYWLLHYVVSGFGEFHMDGRVYKVGPGEIFVIPPHVEVYYRADSLNPWVYTWIGFTASDMLPAKLDAVINCPGAGEIFERMKNCSSLESGKSAYLCSCLWELFSIIAERGKQSTDNVKKALTCMKYEYMTGITVGEIAARLNLDRTYFSALFKKRTGLSPQRYLLNLRMEKAAALMVEQRETPSVAAAAVGYSDIFTFSKAFKAHYGVPPREYINQKIKETKDL